MEPTVPVSERADVLRWVDRVEENVPASETAHDPNQLLSDTQPHQKPRLSSGTELHFFDRIEARTEVVALEGVALERVALEGVALEAVVQRGTSDSPLETGLHLRTAS